MTVKQKRDVLANYCRNIQVCEKCKLKSQICSCVVSRDFNYNMSDAEIIGAYHIVFGEELEELSVGADGTIIIHCHGDVHFNH